jgi:hypothetical protein
VAYLNRELGVHLFDKNDDDDNTKGNNGGPPDPPVINQDVQPPYLTEEETLELAIARSELDNLAKWNCLVVLLRESALPQGMPVTPPFTPARGAPTTSTRTSA